MKNKIINHTGATLLCCLCVVVVTGDSNLKIFTNVDGSLVEVPSKVEVPSGANVTLICKIENIKSKGLVNGYVTWFIPPKVHSELKLSTLKSSSNLVFNNVNANDEGLYVCSSLKFKISKILHLLVKQNKSAERGYLNFPRLRKREIVPGNGPYDFNFTNVPDTRDFTELNDYLAKVREDLMKDLRESEKNANYGHNNDYSYNDVNVNNRGHPNSHSFPVKPVGLVFGVLFIVFMLFLLIRLCGYIKQNSLNNRSNSQQDTYNPGITTAPRVNRCGHLSCARNYLLNPAGACRFHNNTPTTVISPSAPMLFDPMDIVRPPIHDTRNPTTQLDLPDLPPTYSSSTHNSTNNLNDATDEFNKKNLNVADNNNSNLPPSYDEAVGHNDTASHNHNGNHDSGRNDGGDGGQSGGGGSRGGGGDH